MLTQIYYGPLTSENLIHMFSGLLDPDPDPLVRDMDPDLDLDLDPAPDPSITQQR
jgi:hypothetical protein